MVLPKSQIMQLKWLLAYSHQQCWSHAAFRMPEGLVDEQEYIVDVNMKGFLYVINAVLSGTVRH